MRQQQRTGSFSPISWLLVAATMAFLIIRMSNAQPQVYFKANAPAVKSLPRIGRRSDLETFPLPIAPGAGGLLQQSDADFRGNSWSSPENYFLRGSQTFGNGRRDSSIPFIDGNNNNNGPSNQQLQQYILRKWLGLGEPENSDRVNDGEFDNANAMGNIYRSKMRK